MAALVYRSLFKGVVFKNVSRIFFYCQKMAGANGHRRISSITAFIDLDFFLLFVLSLGITSLLYGFALCRCHTLCCVCYCWMCVSQ